MEVAQVWNHVPPSWHVHVDHTLVETTADLIKLASDKEEQLQARSADQIQRLIHVELQRVQAGGSCRPYVTQLADVSKGEENEAVLSETLVLVAEPKTKPAKDSVKSPGNYPYPLATNQSQKVPPRPCRNCGSPLRYDRDCASWRSQGWPPGDASANKTSDAYHKSYIAMLEEDDDSYDSYCATYNMLVDEATSNNRS